MQTSVLVIVPGLGNSGPGHWQTWLEQQYPGAVRVPQRDWDAPNCADWVATLEQTLAGYDPSQVVLVAHSLGCATVAHWAAHANRAIRGALLVAPADVEAARFTAEIPAVGFAPFPRRQLPFASKVVASRTDEWMRFDRARQLAHAWGSALIDAGPAGHLNVASGHGPWPLVQELLADWLKPEQRQ